MTIEKLTTLFASCTIITTQVEVLQILGRLLGRSPRSVTPDAIAALVDGLDWRPCKDWELLSDTEVARTTGLLDVQFSGPLLIVTEACFKPARAGFLVSAPDLSHFIAEHLTHYGECFFSGDVIIAESQGQKAWLFHHESVYTEIRIPDRDQAEER